MRILREAGQVDFVFFSDNPHCPFDVCFCMIAEKLEIKVIILRETRSGDVFSCKMAYSVRLTL